MREILLSQGYVALVDDSDYEWLSKWKWFANVQPHACYARRNAAGKHRSMVSMHRAILGTAPGMQTDHRDGNGLNNQRANLRQCSNQENSRNRRSRLGSSSSFKGVSWYKQTRKWEAYITFNGRIRHLGLFSVEAEAAEAYKVAAATHFGEFAIMAGGRDHADR